MSERIGENLYPNHLISVSFAIISFMGSSVGGKRGIYIKKKKTYTEQGRCGSVRRRSEKSITARRAVPVGLVVFVADEGDRCLRLSVEQVRFGSVGSVLSVATVCLTPLIPTPNLPQ